MYLLNNKPYTVSDFVKDVQIELDNQASEDYRAGFDGDRSSDDVHIGEIIGQLRINLPFSEQDPAEHAANLRSPLSEGHQWWHYVVANAYVAIGLDHINMHRFTPENIARIAGKPVESIVFVGNDAKRVYDLMSMMAPVIV